MPRSPGRPQTARAKAVEVARQVLDEALEVKSDDRLLVNGAGGVTGSLLVSLASLRGAEVLAIAGPHSHERVAALGARHVIDYHEGDWPDQVLAVTGPVVATVLFRLWVMSPLNRALDKRAHRAEPAFDRLLTAARKLFAAEGYAGTSLDAVCDRAGVTKGSLYHHFRGKTELFEAVFEAEARLVTERAAAAMAAEEDPWAAANEALTEFLSGHTRWLPRACVMTR